MFRDGLDGYAGTVDTYVNNGWIISPYPMNGDGCTVDSSENADEPSRPQLAVTFIAP